MQFIDQKSTWLHLRPCDGNSVILEGIWGQFDWITQFQHCMARKRIKGSKYNRVTQQQKYIFLKLCVSEGQTIHQAAHNSGIHYSTAKTILFFHKKKLKNYTTYFVDGPSLENYKKASIRATWRDICLDIKSQGDKKADIELIIDSKYQNHRSCLKAAYICGYQSQIKQENKGDQYVKRQENDSWLEYPFYMQNMMRFQNEGEYLNQVFDQKKQQIKIQNRV